MGLFVVLDGSLMVLVSWFDIGLNIWSSLLVDVRIIWLLVMIGL